MGLLYVAQEAHLVVQTPTPSMPRSASAAPPRPSAQQDMRPTIRRAITDARIDQELSVGELAEATGIPTETLRKYEAGTLFPRAGDIATLEVYLETQLVPR